MPTVMTGSQPWQIIEIHTELNSKRYYFIINYGHMTRQDYSEVGDSQWISRDVMYVCMLGQ